MWVSLFLAAVFVAMIIMEYRDYRKFKEEMKDLEAQYKSFECEPIEKSKIIMSYLVCAVCIGLGIAVLVVPSLVEEGSQSLYAVFGIGMGIFFGANITMSLKKDAFYYNEDGFVYSGKFYRYNLVKEVSERSVKDLRHHFHLFTGESYKISPQYAKKLTELVANYKKNKK